MNNYIRLPLKNTVNTRDLGGYAAGGGQTTIWRAFIRSDDLSFLDLEDVIFLKNYGVNTIIDLRSSKEISELQYPDVSIFQYYNIPLISDEKIGNAAMVTEAEFSKNFLSDFYLDCIEKSKDAIKEVMLTIFTAPEGGIVFHCSAGKDRTGIITALLLGLAGVSNADILANYESTYTYLRSGAKFRQYMERAQEQGAEGAFYSKPETIEMLLNYIDEHYQSIPRYLQRCGLSADIIVRVKQRFCGEDEKPISKPVV